jgi:hypothetical protein
VCQQFRGVAGKDVKKLAAAVVERQSASYPLEKCPVMKRGIGENPVDLVIANRLDRLCCKASAMSSTKDSRGLFWKPKIAIARFLPA